MFKKILFSILIVEFVLPLADCSMLIVNAQWVQVNNGMGNLSINALTSRETVIFAGTGTGVYKSTDNGTNWVQILNNLNVISLGVNGNNDIFAGNTYPNGVYKSTNNGLNWIQNLNNRGVPSLAANGTYVYAGVYFGSGNGGGVYKSTDSGTTWNQNSFLYNRSVGELAVNGNIVFAGTIYTPAFGVYLSTDNGTNWIQTTLNDRVIGALAINGNNVFAGTYLSYGLYLSTDNGISWTQTCLNNLDVISLALNGNSFFAGTDGNGVYAGCLQRNEGLGNLSVRALNILNNYIFAGTGSGIYRRPLSELTGINPISIQEPNQFSLSQNYPNPFNPTTKIRFSLPLPSEGGVQIVSFVIYDVLGREITTLFSSPLGRIGGATYEVEWDASKYPSGVYYYKLSVGEFTQTRKAVLIK